MAALQRQASKLVAASGGSEIAPQPQEEHAPTAQGLLFSYQGSCTLKKKKIRGKREKNRGKKRDRAVPESHRSRKPKSPQM